MDFSIDERGFSDDSIILHGVMSVIESSSLTGVASFNSCLLSVIVLLIKLSGNFVGDSIDT
jgi:hypothetical protein